MGDYEDVQEKAINGYNENEARWASPEKAALMRSNGNGSTAEEARRILRNRYGYTGRDIENCGGSNGKSDDWYPDI